MNKTKRILIPLTIALILICCLFFALFPEYKIKISISTEGFEYYPEDIANLEDIDTIFVAVERDAAGLFYYNNHYYGYIASIFERYAKEQGKPLKFINCNSNREVKRLLINPNIAFGLTIKEQNIPQGIDYNNLYVNTTLGDSTNYTLIGNKRNRALNKSGIEHILDSTKVIYRRGTKEIDMLSDRSNHYLKDTASIRFLETEGYVNLLRKREQDFLICKELEVFFYTYNFWDIVRVHKFEDKVYSNVIMLGRNEILRKNFDDWVALYRYTDSHKEIYRYYHEDEYQNNFMDDGHLEPISRISLYDDMFKSNSRGTSFDWRLMAAICCIESKFRPNLVSHKGAIGLMQVMPANTKRWGINRKQLFVTETNIACAVKLMEENRVMLKIDSTDITDNELCIIIATYNGGYGHVSDAIRLAKKYGEDGNSWAVVKRYLYALRKREYYTQRDVVKSGGFVSDETEKYVISVMGKYYDYKSRVTVF